MLKNKKVLLLLLIFLILFIFSSNIFAVVLDVNGSQVELPDINFKHYVVLKGDNYYLMALDDVYSESANVCKADNSSYKYCEGVTTSNDNYLIKFPYYSLNGNEWNLVTSVSNWTASGLSVIYSTENIYYNDEIFFQKAPQGVLTQIVEQVEMREVMTEIVKIIPLIIVVVVSFLGLRKALQMLSKVLHQS